MGKTMKRIFRSIIYRFNHYILESLILKYFKGEAFLIDKNRIVKIDRSKIFQHCISFTDCSQFESQDFKIAFYLGMDNEPFYNENIMRVRVYNACVSGMLAKNIEGSFCFVGVSWGVTARAIFEYAKLKEINKNCILVDCWDKSLNAEGGKVINYCDDLHFINTHFNESQFSVLKGYAPDILRKIDNKIAFLHLNTGDTQADCESITELADKFSDGSILLIDNYDLDKNYLLYDQYLNIPNLRFTKFSLINGQLLVFVNKVKLEVFLY
jgi:hypothetical protein